MNPDSCERIPPFASSVLGSDYRLPRLVVEELLDSREAESSRILRTDGVSLSTRIALSHWDLSGDLAFLMPLTVDRLLYTRAAAGRED